MCSVLGGPSGQFVAAEILQTSRSKSQRMLWVVAVRLYWVMFSAYNRIGLGWKAKIPTSQWKKDQ